jgi:hypothetical protein
MIQRTADHRSEQRPRIVRAETHDLKLRQPAQLHPRVAHREDERNRFRRQPACDERQRLRRGPVEPLRIVDQADQRPIPGHLGQQAQDREADEEAIGRIAAAQAERGAQCIALGTRQALESIHDRPAQLVQAGEGQLHLRLRARRAHHLAAGGLGIQVRQQRRLADARLAPHHEHPALAPAHRVEQAIQHDALIASAEQQLNRRPLRTSPESNRGLQAPGL